jgi:transcriptional regulator of NAD metabolism
MENINDYQKQIVEHLKTISESLVDISKSLKHQLDDNDPENVITIVDSLMTMNDIIQNTDGSIEHFVYKS